MIFNIKNNSCSVMLPPFQILHIKDLLLRSNKKRLNFCRHFLIFELKLFELFNILLCWWCFWYYAHLKYIQPLLIHILIKLGQIQTKLSKFPKEKLKKKLRDVWISTSEIMKTPNNIFRLLISSFKAIILVVPNLNKDT